MERTMLICSREVGNMVAVTDELLWCSCCINMADTWRFHMSTKYFPKTLLTIDLSVVKHLYYCKLRRNREVFNQILLSCSLAHVTRAVGQADRAVVSGATDRVSPCALCPGSNAAFLRVVRCRSLAEECSLSSFSKDAISKYCCLAQTSLLFQLGMAL